MRMRMMTMAGRATNAFACRAQAAHGQIQHPALCKDEVAREREREPVYVRVWGGGGWWRCEWWIRGKQASKLARDPT